MIKQLFSKYVNSVFIEFGTQNFRLYVPAKDIFINVPSVLELTKDSKKIVTIGSEATKKAEERLSFPIVSGSISNYHAAELFLKHHFINTMKKLNKMSNFFGANVYISLHSTTTEVEITALTDAILSCNVLDVKFINEAAAVFYAAEKEDHSSKIVCNIGAGVTDIVLISNKEIVIDNSIKFGGIDIDRAIQQYVKEKYNLMISLFESRKLKEQLDLTKRKEIVIKIKGKDVLSSLPKSIEIRLSELNEIFKESVETIIYNITKVLEKTPVGLSTEVINNGVVLSGGIGRVSGLKKLLETRLNINVSMGQDEEKSVASGLYNISLDESLLSSFELKDLILI